MMCQASEKIGNPRVKPVGDQENTRPPRSDANTGNGGNTMVPNNNVKGGGYGNQGGGYGNQGGGYGNQGGGYGNQGQQIRAAYGGNGPVVRNDNAPKILPISKLNLYQNRWTIKARVMFKGEIRTWQNARGQGKVFSFDVIDESGEIRCTCFNDVAERLNDLIEKEKVYIISRGSLKQARKQFNNLAVRVDLIYSLTEN